VKGEVIQRRVICLVSSDVKRVWERAGRKFRSENGGIA
jgi:hypothetical protein